MAWIERTSGRRQKLRLDFENLIGTTLQVGVLMSIAFIVMGYLWHWERTRSVQFDYSLPPANLYEFWKNTLSQTAEQWRPRLFINLGIATLLATPYFRVAISLFYFIAVKRNAKYAVFTLAVFLVLTYSLFSGITL
jgi:uncharacterized membrane protein